jgi:hypothetical protein
MPSSNRPNRLPLWLKVGLAVALVLTFGIGNASAALIDPSTLQIGNTATGPYSPTGPGGETVELGSSSFFVWQNQGGASNLLLSTSSPPPIGAPAGFLLLLGIPNNNTTFLGTITSGNGHLASTDYFGGTWNSSGFAGNMTSGGKAYTQAGLSGANASNNFANWSGWDLSVDGITATKFGIYVYEIDASLTAKSSVNISFSSLPQGTFIIAYGEQASSKTNPFDTPFTEAGLTTNGGGGGGGGGGVVPAPPSVVLLGFGGFGLAFILVRSRRRLAAA